MCRDNYNTKKSNNKGSKHLTYKDRIKIEILYTDQGIKNKAEIARRVGFHRSTISREIKRGMTKQKNYDWSYSEVYRADLGQTIKDENAKRKGPNLVISKDSDLADYIETEIENGYSPEIIANWIKKDDSFKIKICAKTIYNYIDRGILLVSHEDLICGKYKKRKTKKESKRTTRQKIGRTIHDRPEVAENRDEVGHWEMDLVIGKKTKDEPVLLVLSERATRTEIIEKLDSKTNQSVVDGLDRIERRMGPKVFREVFKTITTDNGSEFKDYEAIETSFTKSDIPRTKQYYCDAYCSWQRGTNENINRMIRRFLPKGTSFKNTTRKMVKRIQNFINTYPRKMFGFKSANEIFDKMCDYEIKIA